MKLKKIGIGILVVGSAFLLVACNKTVGSQSITTNSNKSPDAGAVVVVFAKDGFSPEKITAKVGQQISVMNTSGASLQFNSDPHPTHTSFPELNLGVIPNGETKSFTLNKAGTYTYHNHLNSTQKGTIIVE